MGSTDSTVEQDVFNSSDLQIDQGTYVEAELHCKSDTSSSNIIDVSNSSDITLKNIKQQNSVKNMCLFDVALDHQPSSEAKVALFNALAAQSEAQGGFPAASSDVYQTMRNQISQKLDQGAYADMITKCVNSGARDNIIRVVNTHTGLLSNVSQINQAFDECMLQSALKSDSTSAIAQEVTNELKAESSAKGMQLAGSSASSGCCCFIFLIIGAWILWKMFGPGGNSGNQGGPRQMTMFTREQGNNRQMEDMLSRLKNMLPPRTF